MPKPTQSTPVVYDMLDEIRRARFTLSVRLPHSHARIEHNVELRSPLADALSPLPRDREIPFAITAQEQARIMQQQRRDAARIIADYLTEFLLKTFTAKDPIQGYSPEEWAQINRA